MTESKPQPCDPAEVPSRRRREGPPPGRPILATAATGSALGFVGAVGGRALALAFQILVSRLYGPTYFGLFVTGMLTCQILHVLASLGLQRGGMRFMSIAVERRDFDDCAHILKVAVLTSLAAALPIVIVGYWLAPIVAQKAFHDATLTPLLRWFLAAVPFLALLRIGSNVSRAFKTAKYAAAIDDVLLPALQIVFFVALHQLGAGFLAVAHAFVLAAILCSLVMVFTVWRQIRGAGEVTVAVLSVPPRATWVEVTAYSLPLVPVGLLFMANNSIDIIMLNILSDPVAVGVYAAAARWVMLFATVTVPLEMMFGPLLAGQFGVNNREQMRLLYQTLTRWAFFLSLPLFVFVCVGRTPLMMLFGDEFLPSGTAILGILVLGSLITALTCGAGITLIVTNNQRTELMAITTGLSLNILLNMLWIPRHGVLGTAFAVLASTAATSLLRLMAVYRSLGLMPFSRHLVVPAAVALLTAVVDFVLLNVFHAGVALQLVMAATGAAVVLFSIAMRGLDKNDMDLCGAFWHKVRRVRGHSSR